MITPQILLEKLDQYTEQIFQGAIAKVEIFNRSKLTAKVQPLLKVDRKGKLESLPVLVDIPVNCLYSGGCLIVPDYKKGDLVWVEFSTYPISNSVKGKFQPISPLRFGLENAIITGGFKMGDVSSDISGENGLVLCHEDGNRVVIGNSQIKVKNQSSVVTVESSQITIQTTSATVKLTSSAVEIESTNITIKGTSKITLDGEVEVKKKLTCNDAISATKSITSDEDVKAGTISLKTHIHTGNLGAPTSPPM